MSPLLLTVKHLARASLCMDLLFQLGEVSEDGPHGTGHTSLRTHGEGPKRKHRRTHGEGPGRNGTQMSNMRLINEIIACVKRNVLCSVMAFTRPTSCSPSSTTRSYK
jgi:hypothetical protein